MEILLSARRHGVLEASIRHAIDHALVFAESDDRPVRYLVLGPDAAGNLLELVAVARDDGDLVVVHAMAMREKYRHLLP